MRLQLPDWMPRLVTPEGIYGSLAVAVLCAAWEGDDLGELALEIVVYSSVLWLFHVYAHVLYGGWASRETSEVLKWAWHEFPHLEAAVPALLVVGLGAARGWDPVHTSDVALWATLANLLVLQVMLMLPKRPDSRTMVLTLLLDAAALAALIWLRLLVK